jgi:hypothetical protein
MPAIDVFWLNHSMTFLRSILSGVSPAILTLPFWLSRILPPVGLALLQFLPPRKASGSQPWAIAYTVLGVGFAATDFLSAITPQIAVLGVGALVLAVVTFVLVSLALRE